MKKKSYSSFGLYYFNFGVNYMSLKSVTHKFMYVLIMFGKYR